MNDMLPTIIPKSDQTNADDFLTGPRTITITGVTIRSGEQPISIHYEGDNGKPYKCCKSMARVLVNAWGPDSKAYVGRAMTLYRDPSVTWAGMAVGGIRISHLSDIDSKMTMALTATKQSRKPYTVQPLQAGAPKTVAPSVAGSAPTSGESGSIPEHSDATATITPDEALTLEARCTDNNIKTATVKKFFKVERFSQMTNQQLADAHKMITDTLAQRAAQ